MDVSRRDFIQTALLTGAAFLAPAQSFPKLTEAQRLALLQPPAERPVPMVLDTDTYNEIDDQFALVYSLISPQQLDLEAVYAAPFHNQRSTSPADGM